MRNLIAGALIIFGLSTPSGASDPSFEHWSEYRDALPMLTAYKEPIEAFYFNYWYFQVDETEGSQRVVYLEAVGKLPWVGTMSFDCRPGDVGDWVTFKQFTDPENPSHHDPSVLFSGVELENWRQAMFEQDVLSDKPTSIVDIPPYEVFVIARYEACKPEPAEYTE